MSHKLLKFSEDLSFPVDAATQTFGFIARKGAGKTYACGKLTELLMDAGVQCVILDTVGNWYGLRISSDGKSQGFDIPVIGGLRGDIPLTHESGALIADMVTETGRSIIIDLSQFNKSQRKHFATAFGERLWERKKSELQPSPLHLVIEESQLIIPQNMYKGEERMVGIFEEIVRLGRNYGIGVSLISQRPQSVNKEVLSQVECLVALQINGSHERKAIREWVVDKALSVDLVDELPSLAIGTAYVWSPQWLGILKKVAIAKKRTFDASATPKVGEKQIKRELKPLDLGALKERMAATIAQAKENDPAELKRQIALLTKQLSTAAKQISPAPPVDPKQGQQLYALTKRNKDLQSVLANLMKFIVEINTRNFPAGTNEEEIKKAIEEGVARGMQRIDSTLSTQKREAQDLTRRADSLLKKAKEILDQDIAVQIEVSHNSTFTLSERPARPPRQADYSPSANGSLPIGEQKVLQACIQYPNGLRREQLTVLTGYKRSSRDAYIQRLREKGFIEISDELVFATGEGVAALPDCEPLPTGDALQDYHRSRLPVGELAVLNILIEAYPEAVDRDVISERTGYQRSSRDAYLQRLRAKELITEPRRGLVCASKELF